MAKNKNDYFLLIEEQIKFCVKASDLLESIFNSTENVNFVEYKEKMHEIEHQADDIHHDILTRLSAEFITPIDQEDILRLVQIIDDITDALDDVVMKFYMFGITEYPSQTSEFSMQVNRCVKALSAAGAELRHFKKPKELRALLIKINTAESNADKIYMEAVHNLFAVENDAKKLIGYKEIYDSLEACCDLCEHAADIIELIIIKNT